MVIQLMYLILYQNFFGIGLMCLDEWRMYVYNLFWYNLKCKLL
jgi:hypothetical protein